MTQGKPVFSEGRVHIMADKCTTCVFRPGNLMHLEPGRLKDMVDTSIEQGGGIACHKTIYGQADQEATCRGFYDSYKDQVPALALAEEIGIIEEVQVSGNGEGS